jgi:hypothetical protein
VAASQEGISSIELVSPVNSVNLTTTNKTLLIESNINACFCFLHKRDVRALIMSIAPLYN